jgi:hypothetical protein
MHIKIDNSPAHNEINSRQNQEIFASPITDSLCEAGQGPANRFKSLYLNSLEFPSKVRLYIKNLLKRFPKKNGFAMPFSVRHENSFAVVSFAGLSFQTTTSFGIAIERHQKTFLRMKKTIFRLLRHSRLRRRQVRELKWRLACAEITIRELDGKRKSYWRRRNSGG